MYLSHKVSPQDLHEVLQAKWISRSRFQIPSVQGERAHRCSTFMRPAITQDKNNTPQNQAPKGRRQPKTEHRHTEPCKSHKNHWFSADPVR